VENSNFFTLESDKFPESLSWHSPKGRRRAAEEGAKNPASQRSFKESLAETNGIAVQNLIFDISLINRDFRSVTIMSEKRGAKMKYDCRFSLPR
jgi:hypothetical protein